MTISTNPGSNWSVAYAVAIKRVDSHYMLNLLNLLSWPNLNNMHGDLVDDLRQICGLLAKRPMVGFLIARRLKLPVDKTYALLTVLKQRGHVVTIGAKTEGLDISFDDVGAVVPKDLQNRLPMLPELNDISDGSTDHSIPEPVSIVKKTPDTGDVLKQLWRVLNTDITASAAAADKEGSGGGAGEVLSQLWRVLNTDILASEETEKQASSVDSTASTAKESSTKIDAAAKTEVNDNANTSGQVDSVATKEKESTDVMGQLWNVLNTEIAFKRQSNEAESTKPQSDNAKEATEVMRQLWRVLNTEIATKRESSSDTSKQSATDTTKEANARLGQLWKILDSEITLKKKASTYVIHDPDSIYVTDLQNTAPEAVDRLSQLWEMLNAEITIATPAARLPSREKAGGPRASRNVG